LKRLASQEMDEARRISKLIRYVVGPDALSKYPTSTAVAAAASSRYTGSHAAASAVKHLSAAVTGEISRESAAGLDEARGESAAATAAAAAARSSVATYLAHLEGVSDFMHTYKFEPLRDYEPSSSPRAPPSAPPPPHETPATSSSKILGPAWTRGRVERPSGTKDMGAWRESVCVVFHYNP
jgi:hypothetical protein